MGIEATFQKARGYCGVSPLEGALPFFPSPQKTSHKGVIFSLTKRKHRFNDKILKRKKISKSFLRK
jgi:hypothetical protein